MCAFVLLVAARNHVNRMCLAADVPLVESGTAGYLGQATVIKKVCDLRCLNAKEGVEYSLQVSGV